MFLETHCGDLRIKLNVPMLTITNHANTHYLYWIAHWENGKKTFHSLVLKDNITVL